MPEFVAKATLRPAAEWPPPPPEVVTPQEHPTTPSAHGMGEAAAAIRDAAARLNTAAAMAGAYGAGSQDVDTARQQMASDAAALRWLAAAVSDGTAPASVAAYVLRREAAL